MARRPTRQKTAHTPRRTSTPARPRRSRARPAVEGVTLTEIAELDVLRRELERAAARPPRWNADPDDVQKSLAQLVLTLVEFLRRLLERQAIRRFDRGTLSDKEAEDVGRALMQLEESIRDMAATFGIDPDDLNLDLGPVGTLL